MTKKKRVSYCLCNVHGVLAIKASYSFFFHDVIQSIRCRDVPFSTSLRHQVVASGYE